MSRIALLFDPWMLSHRGGTLDLDGYRDDPRGLTGSEMAAVRLYEELNAAGHTVTMFTSTTNRSEHPYAASALWLPWDLRGMNEQQDVAISINCPDPLRDVKAKFKVCYALLNDWTFCKAGFEQHVDLFASPSKPHLDQVLNNPEWRKVETSPEHPNGKAQYEPDPAKWVVVPLGCDPERYEGFEKSPGRVIYSSSPDRGLHFLLQEWPHIKRAVPWATLRIFYRLRGWIESMKQQCDPEDGRVHLSVWPNVQRALYIEEALRRMSGPEWGITVCDSVSRAQIEREMAEAEVLAYPCDPLNNFTEGFSCSTLEGCAAKACPVITDADALGQIYGAGNNSPHNGAAAIVIERNRERRPELGMAATWQEDWRNNVIDVLKNADRRFRQNQAAETFAGRHTWQATAQRLMAEIARRM